MTTRESIHHVFKDIEFDSMFSTLHCKFNFSVFFEMYLVHFLFPFSLPYFYFTYGMQEMKKHALWGWDFQVLYNAYFLQALYFIILLLAAAFQDEIVSCGVSQQEIGLYILLPHIRYIYVAAKYGLLTKEETARFRAQTDIDHAVKWREEFQLITGWLVPLPGTIFNELKLAASFHDLNVSGVHFSMDLEDRRYGCWKQFLSGTAARAVLGEDLFRRYEDYLPHYMHAHNDEVFDEDADDVDEMKEEDHELDEVLQQLDEDAFTKDTKEQEEEPVEEPVEASHEHGEVASVPAHHLLVSVFFQTLFNPKPMILLGILIGFTKPLLFRISEYALQGHFFPFPNSPDSVQATESEEARNKDLALVVMILGSLSLVQLYFFLMTILGTGILHYQRQYAALNLLGELIRHKSHLNTKNMTPVLDVSYANNVLSWIYLRITLQHVGARYLQRIKLYTAVSFFFLIGLVLNFIVQVATANDPFNVVNSSITYSVLQDTILMTVGLALMAYYGSLSNGEYLIHKSHLVRHLIDIRNKIGFLFHHSASASLVTSRQGNDRAFEVSYHQEEDYEGVNPEFYKQRDFLESSVRILQAVDQAYYITLLGIRCEFGLVPSILTVGGTVLSIMISQFFV